MKQECPACGGAGFFEFFTELDGWPTVVDTVCDICQGTGKKLSLKEERDAIHDDKSTIGVRGKIHR